MDAELAASVIDDAFQAFGTPECAYASPDGEAFTATVIRHRRITERGRPGFSLGRGALETTDRASAIIVRRSEVPQPERGGIFTVPRGQGAPAARFRIGEDPLEDDVNGLTWRCAVEVL